MVLDGDERDVALAGDVAEPFLDARRRQAVTATAHHFDGNELARLRAIILAGLDLQFMACLLVDRHDARSLPLGMAEDAEHAGAAPGKLADDARRVREIRILAGIESRQYTIADGGRPRFFARSFGGTLIF